VETVYALIRSVAWRGECYITNVTIMLECTIPPTLERKEKSVFADHKIRAIKFPQRLFLLLLNAGPSTGRKQLHT
jgi:hypothetical protein